MGPEKARSWSQGIVGTEWLVDLVQVSLEVHRAPIFIGPGGSAHIPIIPLGLILGKVDNAPIVRSLEREACRYGSQGRGVFSPADPSLAHVSTPRHPDRRVEALLMMGVSSGRSLALSGCALLGGGASERKHSREGSTMPFSAMLCLAEVLSRWSASEVVLGCLVPNPMGGDLRSPRVLSGVHRCPYPEEGHADYPPFVVPGVLLWVGEPIYGLAHVAN